MTTENILFEGKIDKLKKEIKIAEETGQIPESLEDKFDKASELYEESQEALSQGDFSTYAEKIEELGRILNQD